MKQIEKQLRQTFPVSDYFAVLDDTDPGSILLEGDTLINTAKYYICYLLFACRSKAKAFNINTMAMA